MIYRDFELREMQPGKWEVKRTGKSAEYWLGTESAVLDKIDRLLREERKTKE